jgi:replicative DNA helicase|tara:strand:- start:127 stop:1380 length:1254 start_codon:yes stop_codon:yes gene_type:complete
MIEIALLRIIKYKAQFDKICGYIPDASMDKTTVSIAKDIGKYFELCPTEEVINFEVFNKMFFENWHKKLKDSDQDYFKKVIKRMEEDESEEITAMMINSLIELEAATNVANLVSQYESGEEIEFLRELHALTDEANKKTEFNTSMEFADVDDNTIADEGDDEGLTWPWDCMNETYRNIHGGDAHIVAARPGMGKTTFLTQLNAHIAPQLEEHKFIVWFNNESKRQRIMAHQIKSALGKTSSELKELKDAGTMREEYIKAVGHPSKIRVFDVHGMAHYQIDEMLEKLGHENIGLIVFDMLDNLRYPVKEGTREDQRLESLYKWARELGVKLDCPTFQTSQVSNEGANLLFPLEGMLKDSKTGKQGACDNIIMIGCESDDPLAADVRAFSMPKTKTKREGQPDLREENMRLNSDIGRYV